MLWADPVTVILKKSKKGYGFTVVGSDPARVGEVYTGSSAHKSGLRKDDCIVRVNGQNVAEMTADGVARAIKAASKQIIIDIQRPRRSTESRGSTRQPITAILNRSHSLQGILGTEEECRESGIDVGKHRPVKCLTTALPQVVLNKQDLSAVELTRQNAIDRMIKYEEAFMHSSQFGAQKHRQALRQHIGNNKTFSLVCSLVFQHVEKLCSVLSHVLEELHDNSLAYMDVLDPKQRFVDGVGAVYQTKVTGLLEAYEAYFDDLAQARSVVESLTAETSATAIYTQDRAVRQLRKSLKNFITKPEQHLRGLLSHLRTVLCYTSPQHHDYSSLIHVVQVLQEGLANLTQSPRLGSATLGSASPEGSMRSSRTSSSTSSTSSHSTTSSAIDPRLQELDKQLTYAQNVKCFRVAVPSRQLIHRGKLVLIDGRRWVPLEALIFSDLMLLTTQEEDDQLIVVENPIYFYNICGLDFGCSHPLEFTVTFRVRTKVVNQEVCWERRSINLRAQDADHLSSWQRLMKQTLPELFPQTSATTLGVHLEEPLTPGRSWDADLDETSQHFFERSGDESGIHVSPMSHSEKSSASNISDEFSEKCTVSPQGYKLRAKSESPSTHTDSSTTTCLGAPPRMPCLSAPDRKSRIPSPEHSQTQDSSSPDPKDSRVQFSFGSDSDTEEKPPTSARLPPSGSVRSSSSKESHRRGRFRRILRPLRRSHSAGCAKDVPAHALFLKHEMEKKNKQLPRRSFDQQASFESDTDETSVEKKGSKKKRSFTKDMREKFAFLRRRHTDTSLSGDKGKPTPENALHWSKSFENLILDKNGLELFRGFLRSEFSDENLEFWIACEDYKNIKNNSAKLAEKAHQIYGDYVAIQAPHEINLDSKTRFATMSNLSNPTSNMFEIAQKKIQALMEKDSYPRFLQSDTYQSLLGNYKVSL